MNVRHTIIYKICGANRLPDDAEHADLLTFTSPALRATLTTDPEPDFTHIDKSAALANQLLKGMFAPEKQGTWEERLAGEIEGARVRRAEQGRKGVFLILHGESDIPTPDFKHHRDMDEFAVCIDAISKPAIRDSFRPAVEAVLAALGLSLPENADRRIEKIGDVIYLVDQDTGKPVYAFTLQGGSARASVATAVSKPVLKKAAVLAPKLLAQKSIARPASLLITSLEQATQELQGFIAAWSALEIFINASFKSAYEARWFAVMEGGAPPSGKPVFERFREVMSDKYRLADKFLVIASVLDPTSATDDGAEFRRLKKFRDELLHALDAQPSALPTDAVQKLLLKYMKLHLASDKQA